MDIQTIGTVTYNEPKLVDQTVPTFRRILGDKNVVQIGAQMVAEDFSFYQQVIPGFFYFMGVRNEAKGTIHPVHTPEFDIDEDVMPLGVKVIIWQTHCADYSKSLSGGSQNSSQPDQICPILTLIPRTQTVYCSFRTTTLTFNFKSTQCLSRYNTTLNRFTGMP